jgi:FtsP/CotA-like multicopper oxidase with cupredoxin domain
MTPSRREILKFLGAASLAVPFGTLGCSLKRGAEPKLLKSQVRLPEPFVTPLQIPPILKPTQSDAEGDFYEITVGPGRAEILPGFQTEVWGYGGIFPGPTIEARSGRRVVIRARNELPVPIVNHLHGGCAPPESDGYPTDFVLPVGGSFPVSMPDPVSIVAQGTRDYAYPNEQRAATLWYHDHRMDFTGPQVWRGLAGFYIIRDKAEDALPLPRDDRDIPLMICDRSFAADGSFLYPSLNPSLRDQPGVQSEHMGGVLGDVIMVNGVPWPRHEVTAARYRFRFLNASNARRYELELDPPPSDGNSFIQIGSDGGLLDAPITHSKLKIAPAERFDVIIDFSKYGVGSIVTLRNRAGDGQTNRIMRFHVSSVDRDESYVPPRLVSLERLDPAGASVTRKFHFSSGDIHGHSGWTINGQPFDPTRMDAQPKLGAIEIWQLSTDVHHPIHLHLVHFQALSRGRGPGPYNHGWKDTIDLGPAQTLKIIMRFDGYKGRYVFHCHNLEHEDMAMMGNFEVI